MAHIKQKKQTLNNLCFLRCNSMRNRGACLNQMKAAASNLNLTPILLTVLHLINKQSSAANQIRKSKQRGFHLGESFRTETSQ